MERKNFTPPSRSWILIIGTATSDLKPENQLEKLVLTVEEQKRLILLDTNFTYSSADAKKDAQQIADELNAKDGLKRTVGEAFSFAVPDTIRFPNSKRENDPGFHIFNFSNNGGFAIISADKRAPNRLGWTDAGNLDSKEPHAVFGLVLPRLAYLIQDKRQEVENMRGDKYHIDLLTKIANFNKTNTTKSSNGRVDPCQIAKTNGEGCPGFCSLSPYTALLSSQTSPTTIVAPLLATNWGQGPPFNNDMNGNSVGGPCTEKNLGCNSPVNNEFYHNNNVAAGCIPVSEAMVVAYFWGRRGVTPTTGSLNPADWAAIANNGSVCNNTPQQVSSISALIRRIFVNYNVTWSGCSENGGTAVDNTGNLFGISEQAISPTFNLQQKQFRAFYSTDVTASIQTEASPVLVQGFSRFITIGCFIWCWDIADLNSGHQWVMDGITDVNKTSTYLISQVDYNECVYRPAVLQTTVSFVNRYHHSNWGWGGYHNGWFLTDTFGGNGRDNDFNPGNNTSDTYWYQTRMLGSIWPL
jgi:hypothetical protein